MKLKYKINFVSLGILTAVTCAVALVGILTINQVVIDLNRKLMSMEVHNLIATIRSAHQVLKEAGVGHVESYVRKAQEDLIAEFRNYRFGSTGKLAIADRRTATLLLDPLEGNKGIRPSPLHRMIREGRGSMERLGGEDARFYCFDTYPDWSWTVILSVTSEEVLEARTKFLESAGIILLPGLILGSLLFLWFTDRLVKPIHQLATAAASVSRGEWDVPLPNPRGEDEISQLAAAFREMSAKLSATYRNLQENLNKVERSQEALAAEKELLAVTLRSIADGVITTDVNGKVALMNKVAEAMTGWSQEEGVGRSLGEVFEILDESTGERWEHPVEEVIRKGEIIDQPDHTVLVARNGRKGMVALSGAPILDQGGEILGMVLVFRDITEKTRMEEEFFKAQKLESVGLLAGGIAHDFNNILTAIMGNISLAMMDAKPDAKISRRLEETLKASLRAKDLTQQLLTFSKGGTPIKKIHSISDLIRSSTLFALTGSNVRCEFRIAPDLWPAEVDEGQIGQVIHNLVLNADQAMPEGGLIKVRAENLAVSSTHGLPLEPGNYVKISIRDEGTGISREYLPKIFDPYFTTKHRGNGLGLAVVHSIVAKHGGLITVESELGSGTTFHIYLEASDREIAEERHPQRQLPTGRGRILLMDDEEIVGEVVGEMLGQLGYRVVLARNGEQALERYRESLSSRELFDAVILDLTIPGGMGGKETVVRLREMDPDVRAVVSSGYSNDPIMGDFGKYGFSGVISKPYRLQELARVLNDVTTARTT